jgi:hypothetical protein
VNTITTIPPVTQAHRRAAFEAMHWAGWTFDAAMANDMRRRLIESRAHQMRTSEYCQAINPTPQAVRRVRLDARGNVQSWCTQIVMGPRTATAQPDLLGDSGATP